MSLLEPQLLPRLALGNLVIRTFEEFTALPVETVRELAARVGLNDIGQVQAEKVWNNARLLSALAHRLLLATSRRLVLRAVLCEPWRSRPCGSFGTSFVR